MNDHSKAFVETERISLCPACGSSRIATAFEADIAQCSECDLLFRNPRPTQEEIARSYDTGDTFATWQEEESARTPMWQRRAMLCRRFQSSGKLLDVGTGDGRFLQTCRTLGHSVVGTEVSESGANYVRKRGFDVRMGQIVDLELPSESFDVVTIWHVLEHVPDPGAVLRKVFGLLRPGGILAVAVPKEENYFVRRALRLGVKNSPFDPLFFGGEIHLTYFRPATLRATLRSAGIRASGIRRDDLYSVRDAKMNAKLVFQRTLARTLGWHFGGRHVCRQPARLGKRP